MDESAGRRQPVTALGDGRMADSGRQPTSAPYVPSREARLRNGKQACARQKALTKLKQRFPAEYDELYQIELAKLGIADHRPIGRPPSPRP